MRSIPSVKIQSWADFKKDLLTAAKGGPAPTDAGGLVVESVTALNQLNARNSENPTSTFSLRLSKDDPVKNAEECDHPSTSSG
jgi:hypothetical protein